ncbi:calpain large subunit, domain III [Ostertagia ostertagi]
MPWDSFIQYFTDISVCQLINTKVLSTSRKYHEKVFYGEWTTNGAKSGAPNDFAGGCLNFSATCCNNPQFLLNVSKPGEIMLALTQSENNEGMKKRDPYVTIGIHVMKVENNRMHRIHQAMTPAGTSDYASARSIFLHLRDVPVGRYIALPTTFAPREQSTFMLRIYSDHNVDPQVLLKHAPSLGLLGCRHATSVTRITVLGVSLDNAEEVRVHCVLESGKKKVRTSSVEGRGDISWGEQFVFYRSAPSQHFEVELWNDRTSPVNLMSRIRFAAPIDNDTRELMLKLDDSLGKTIGYLKVIVAAFDDPMYL